MDNEGQTPDYLIGEVFPPNEDQDSLLEYCDSSDPFHIGQHEESPARQISCRRCGSRNFHVAQGHYYTAIRCAKCLWECGIHSG